jgi:hypothetical protein
MLWLLASEAKDGRFDGGSKALAFRLRMEPKEVENALEPLILKGFFLDASAMLAGRLRDATPETETEREKSPVPGDTDTNRKVRGTAGRPSRHEAVA